MRRDDLFLEEIAARWRRRNLHEKRQAEDRKQSARAEALRLARAFAEKAGGVRRVYLFGSCVGARRFGATSDIDLAIEGGDLLDCIRISYGSRFAVDVIDLADAGERMRARIRSEGELLYAAEQ